MIEWVVLSISTLRVRLVPGATRSTRYELARGSWVDAPARGMRRIPRLPDPAADWMGGDANAMPAGATAPAPTSTNRTRRRTRTVPSRFAQATEWVIVAE